MPCPGPFHFSYSVDYSYDFCPLPDPDVGLSIFVCDVEHTSFHFGLCGRKFVLCSNSRVSVIIRPFCCCAIAHHIILETRKKRLCSERCNSGPVACMCHLHCHERPISNNLPTRQQLFEL